MFRTNATVLLLAALSVACNARFTDRPSASALEEEASRRLVGWSGVAASIQQNDSLRSHTLTQICGGNPQWIAVAREIYPTSYAHLNEEVNSALAAALARSPTEVLRAFGSDVCHEPNHLPAACDISSWHNRVRLAVAGVQDPSVAVVKRECEGVLGAGT